MILSFPVAALPRYAPRRTANTSVRISPPGPKSGRGLPALQNLRPFAAPGIRRQRLGVRPPWGSGPLSRLPRRMPTAFVRISPSSPKSGRDFLCSVNGPVNASGKWINSVCRTMGTGRRSATGSPGRRLWGWFAGSRQSRRDRIMQRERAGGQSSMILSGHDSVVSGCGFPALRAPAHRKPHPSASHP